MEFRNEPPIADGRYLCIVENDIQPSWIRPVILTWRRQWLLPTSEIVHKWPVYGWLGPLPVGKLRDFVGQDFDPGTGEIQGVAPSPDISAPYGDAADGSPKQLYDL